MLLEAIFGVLASLIVFSAGIGYARQTIKRKVRPTLVTLLIWEMGITVGFLAYLSTKHHSILGNVLNLIDTIEVSFIFLVALATRPRYKKIYCAKLLLAPRRWTKRFGRLRLTYRVSLFGSLLGIILWKVATTPRIAFACFQCIMAIAYIPLFERLWRSRKNPEDYRIWIMMLFASLFGLYSPIKHLDTLGMFYSGRAIIFIIMALSLMYRIERRTEVQYL